MSNFQQFLQEASLKECDELNESLIRSAGASLYGKAKTTPDHVASQEKGHVNIHTYKTIRRSGSDKEKTYHVVSHGPYRNSGTHKIGSQHTHGSGGQASKLVGVSEYKNGKKTKTHGEDHSANSHSIHVFK
ncbi:hypothetical protein [Xanthomonas phage X1]|nr:hypothetical protein [Xanthomonas phage X1]